MSLSFKAEKKKVKKAKRENDLQQKKNNTKTEHCDTRTHDVIRRNFEESSSREINL